MTFLNPFLLFGLVGAAIPLVLHLLNLKKLRTVEFSSLRFLKELQRSRIRKIKIRQLLLLLLRTLLIVFLVLSFARPALHGPFAGFGGERAHTLLMIILDDSPSMSVRDEHGLRFDQAKEAARRILATVRPGDRVVFQTLSAFAEHEPLSIAPSLDAVRRAITSANVSSVRQPMSEAVRAVRTFLTTPREPNNELYLLTDAQASLFRTTTQTGDTTPPPEAAVRTFVLHTPAQEVENAGISALRMQTQVLVPGKPVRVEATVVNHGRLPRNGLLVSGYLDGARVAQQMVDVQGGSAAQLTLDLTPKHRGPVRGYFQIEDDAFAEDNTRFFSFDVPERVAVALVGNDPRQMRFPSLALSLGGDSTATRLYTVDSAPSAVSNAVAGADVVMFCNVLSWTPAEAAQVGRLADQGRGLIFFTGPEIDEQNYARALLPVLGLLPSRKGPASTEDTSGSFLSFSHVDYDHPLLKGLLATSQQPAGARPAFVSPRFKRIAELPERGRAQRIIGLSDGRPFLNEYIVHKSHILWFAVDAGARDSDFPLTSIYAPLLHRAAAYLAGQENTAPSVTSGAPLPFSLPHYRGEIPAQVVVRSPSGLDQIAAPHVTTRGLQVEAPSAQETGIYSLLVPQQASSTLPLAYAAANVDSAESNLRPVDAPELQRFCRAVGLSTDGTSLLAVDERLEQTVAEARIGIELWRYALICAVLCALLEMVIARVPPSEVPHE
jgi:hypothetical protein